MPYRHRTVKTSIDPRVFLAGLLILLGCNAYSNAAKQLRTFSNMLNTARHLQKIAEEKGSVQDSKVASIVNQINGGFDEWGSPIVFMTREEPTFSLILVSPGSDRRIDVQEIEQYFDLPENRLAGDSQRDIVFRDGKSITISSPK